jgi:hypothetical protein
MRFIFVLHEISKQVYNDFGTIHFIIDDSTQCANKESTKVQSGGI